MAIVVTAPPTAPANFVAVAEAGGTLPAGKTYEFRMSYKNNAIGTGINYRISKPTSIQNTTTDATKKKIKLSWGALSPYRYADISYREQGDIDWIHTKYGSSNYNSFDDSGYIGYVYFDGDTPTKIYPSFMWQTNKDIPIPTGVDNLGCGNIVISGSAGSLTGQDIKDAMVTAGCGDHLFLNEVCFCFAMQIKIDSGASGSLDLSGKLICNVWGNILNYTNNFSVNAQGSTINLGMWNFTFQFRNWNLNKCTLSIGLIPYTPFVWSTNQKASAFLNTTLSNIHSLACPMWTSEAGAVFENLNFFDGGYLRIAHINKIDYTKALNCSIFYIFIIVNVDFEDGYLYEFRGNEFSGGVQDIWLYYGTGVLKWHSNKFGKGYTIYGTYNKPRILWGSVWAQSITIEIYRNIKLKVQDSEGIVKQGGSAKIYDKDGNLLYTEITDVNGGIDKDALVTTGVYGGSSSATDYTDKVPLKIIISLDGYFDYTLADLYLEEDMVDIVTLKEVVPPVYVDRALTGEVSQQEISGEVEQQEISGTVEVIEIEGTVEEISIEGTVDQQKIDGNVD